MKVQCLIGGVFVFDVVDDQLHQRDGDFQLPPKDLVHQALSPVLERRLELMLLEFCFQHF